MGGFRRGLKGIRLLLGQGESRNTSLHIALRGQVKAPVRVPLPKKENSALPSQQLSQHVEQADMEEDIFVVSAAV